MLSLFFKRRYLVAGQDYLQRAKSCLAKGRNEDLFYAAFELRCGIESRMREYLESREEISKSKKEDWRINKLGESLKEHLFVTDKIVRIIIRDEKTLKALYELRYVPISEKLQKMGQRLGDLLHAQKAFIESNALYWTETRNYLNEVAKELEKSCSGTILAPPIKENGNELKLTVTGGKSISIKKLMKNGPPLGATVVMDIKHLDFN